jgi:hypothetical protein
MKSVKTGCDFSEPTSMNKTTDPTFPPSKEKQSFRLLPLYLISAAFLSFIFLPSFYPSAGVFAAPLTAVLVVAACILTFAPGFALLELVGRRFPASLAPGLVIIGSAAAGWLLFWAWFASPYVGIGVSIGLSASAMLVLSFKRDRQSWQQVSAPAIVSVMVCVGYLSLAGDHGGLNYGDQLIAGRYWAVMDNQIPRLFADRLIEDRVGLKSYLLGDWHSSDRPPLQTGMLLLAYPFVGKAGSLLACLLLGVAINIFWIWGLWGFLRALGIDERRIFQAVILVALVGAVFINTIYTWPKMLSAALALTVGAAILVKDCPKQIRIWIIGSAGAFSLLSHGAAIFALLGLITLFWVRRKEWQLRDVFITFALTVLIYYPWIGYQQFYDPPGDRLIKWHLAGVTPSDETRSAAAMLMAEYKKAGFHGFAVNKVHNLRTLLGDSTDWNGEGAQGFAQPGWDSTFIGHLRHFFLLRLGPAPTLLLIGVAFLFIPAIRRAPWFIPLMGMLIATLLIFTLLEFGSTPSSAAWLWHAPYTALLVWCMLGALAIGELGDKWVLIFLLFHVILFIALWDYGVSMCSALPPPVNPGKPDFVAMLMAALAFLALVMLLLRTKPHAATADE